MTKDSVGVNVQLPKPIHERAKAKAKAADLSMKDYFIKLIESDGEHSEASAQTDLVTLLSRPRFNERFGDETILEEILRRVVSMHLLTADSLSQEKGVEAAKQSLKRIDEMTEEITNQR